jgi:hypothetical protein
MPSGPDPALSRLLSAAIDFAAKWIWRSGNMPFVGPHTMHFCYDGLGRRTIEINARTVAVGARSRTAT